MSNNEFGFFLPCPTEVHPDVLQAMNKPMIPHRGPAMVDLQKRIAPRLKQLFRTEKNVLIGTCSATGFMEMAVRSGVRHRALSLVGGAYGEQFAGIVAASGREVIRLNVREGRTVEPDMLDDALKRSEVDAVTLVHSETSTGALAPLEELAEVVSNYDDRLLIVDGVTSVAGCPVETDKWNLDFVFTGSQGALALPPGMAFGVASERMTERAKTLPERGAVCDLLAYETAALEYQPTHTPAISLLFGLDEQLTSIESSGGIEARWEKHKLMRERVEQWVDGSGGASGFGLLPEPGRRSWTVSCLTVPEGFNGRKVAKAVEQHGQTVGTGYGKLKSKTVRIGHMGEHGVESLNRLLESLEVVARELDRSNEI